MHRVHKSSHNLAWNEGSPLKLTYTTPFASHSCSSRRERVHVFHSQILQQSTASCPNSTNLQDWSLVLQHHRITLTCCNTILLDPHKGTKTEQRDHGLSTISTEHNVSVFPLQLPNLLCLNTGWYVCSVCIVKVLYCTVNMWRPASTRHDTGS